MQLSIDNSALNNILNVDEDVKKLANLIKQKNVVLIVPLDTLTEAVSGANLDFVHTRMARLHFLIETVGPTKCILARDSYNWIKREHRRKGSLKNIPSLVNSPRWPNLLKILIERERLEEIHRSLAEERNRQERTKADLRSADLQFREKMRGISDVEIREKIRNFSANIVWKDVGVFYPAFSNIFSRRKLRRVLSRKDRYFHIRAYLGLLLLRSLGNSINAFSKDDELAFFGRIKNGNWFDLGGIALSARISHLVTDDNDQYALTALAKRCGLIRGCPRDR